MRFGSQDRIRAAICVGVAGCGPTVLTDVRWDQAVARPALAEVCTVTVEDTGPLPATRIYTAEGRLVWGQNRLEYDSLSEERVEHDTAGRVAVVTTRYERGFRQGKCDVIGGCDEPAARQLARTRFGYDAAGRIVRAITDTTHYQLDRDHERWIEVDTDDEAVGFRYDAAGRLIERRGSNGVAHFRYRGDALISASFRSHVDSDEVVERDDAGRWSRIDQGHAVRTFEYDDDARLTRVVTVGTGDGLDTDQTWRYDAVGRVVYQDRGYANLPDTDRNGTAYRYDAAGRLVAIGADTIPLVRYRYDGACDRVVVEPELAAPQPVDVAFGPSCASSPGLLVTVCAPTPR